LAAAGVLYKLGIVLSPAMGAVRISQNPIYVVSFSRLLKA
jgi:hypothetical protein